MRPIGKTFILLGILASLALPTIALGATRAALEGADAGHFDVIANACGPNSTWARVHIIGAGSATLLGKYSYEANECFDGKLFYFGSFTMRTSKGNTIVGTYSGTVGPTSDPNVASYDQDAKILGGTGRFARASGAFHVSGLANLATGAYSQKLIGTLSRSRPGA